MTRRTVVPLLLDMKCCPRLIVPQAPLNPPLTRVLNPLLLLLLMIMMTMELAAELDTLLFQVV